MKRDYSLFLKDILQAITDIENFVSDMDFHAFYSDRKTRSAVAHQIEIIGEATKNVPKSIRDRYKELPWQDMAKMRDKISHFYFGINYEIVMNTNIRTRGNPMCTIMSIKINMALMIINIPDMREKSIDTKIKRKKLNIHLSKKKVSGYY